MHMERNKALLADWFSAALQTSRKARRLRFQLFSQETTWEHILRAQSLVAVR